MQTRTRRHPMAYAVSAACALTLLSACGSASQDADSSSTRSTESTSSPTTSPSAPGSPVPTPESPTPSTSPTARRDLPPGARARATTQTGRVLSDDNGCLVFKTDRDAQQWVLTGNVKGLKAGDRLRVEGVAIDTLDANCAQGLPFHVEKATRTVAGGTAYPDDLTPTPGATGAQAAPSVLTGTVSDGVENGCRILRTDKGAFVLLGSVTVPDGKVEVTGRLRPDMMSVCQQGALFEVQTVRTLR